MACVTDRSKKTIRVGTIGVRVAGVLDPSGSLGVGPTDQLSKFYTGDNPTKILADKINNQNQFKLDKLKITTGDIRNSTSVLSFVSRIISKYENDLKWKVCVI